MYLSGVGAAGNLTGPRCHQQCAQGTQHLHHTQVQMAPTNEHPQPEGFV